MDERKMYPNQTTPPAVAKRNAKILRLHAAGSTCLELAQLCGISRQRVYQILARARKAAQ